MSQPPVPYDRIFNFETFSTTNPTIQQPGVQIDGELDALKITVDSLISRLSEIQRSDGKLNPQAFESTGIPESIASSAYSQVYAQLQPLVLAASQSASASASSASTAGNHANAAQSSAASANAAIAPAVAAKDIAVTKAAEAQNWAAQANASASTAASAEVETQSHKQSTLDARDEAQQALSSVINLKASLDNQYDNMLDADQNLSDVSSKGQSVTNLGLNSSDSSDRAIYNRFKSMFHMYVDPNEALPLGQQSYLTADHYLQGMFGLTFNESTGLFVRSATGGTWFGEEVISGNGQAEDTTIGVNKTLADRVAVLKIRMSVISSIMRTTMYRISKYWGYNGDNRLVTLQDFADNPHDNLGIRIWMMIAGRTENAISSQLGTFDAPADGKQYARKNNSWEEVAASGGGVSEYDNFKVYNANDIVWLGSFVYRFNAFIGAAGYGPVTHPAAWTKLSASEISDINGLQAAIDGKASLSHTHSISDVSGLQTALDAKATTVALSSGLAGKANTSHSHSISNVTGLQAALDGKALSVHTHEISSISGLTSALSVKLPAILSYSSSYDQSTLVTTPGSLTFLGYNGGTNGTVTISGPIGSRFFFYQSTNASNSIAFTGAVQVENKFFTKGPKSWVEAVVTPDGVVLNGDLMFPPSGYLISSSCDYVSGYLDAQGVTWDGNFYSNKVYADGSGGTYSSGGYNQDGCWYPYGFCLQSGITLSESTLSWSGCSSSGTFVYSSSSGNRYADGSGGTYDSVTGGWSAQYGDIIYDNGNSCLVKYDGMGGYYVEDNSGNNGYPSYGSYIGQGSGTLYVNYGYNIGDLAVGTYTNDQYADGNGGVAYTENQVNSYYSYGTYLAYDDYNGYGVYSDGNGSYYTSA